MLALDAGPKPLGRGDEEVVAEQLDRCRRAWSSRTASRLVVLAERVLDRDDRVVVDPGCELVDELLGPEAAVLAREHVPAVDEKLRRGDIDGDRGLGSRLEPAPLDPLEQDVERGPVRRQRCGEPALVGDERRVVAALAQDVRGRGTHARGPLDRLRERLALRPGRRGSPVRRSGRLRARHRRSRSPSAAGEAAAGRGTAPARAAAPGSEPLRARRPRRPRARRSRRAARGSASRRARGERRRSAS